MVPIGVPRLAAHFLRTRRCLSCPSLPLSSTPAAGGGVSLSTSKIPGFGRAMLLRIWQKLQGAWNSSSLGLGARRLQLQSGALLGVRRPFSKATTSQVAF